MPAQVYVLPLPHLDQNSLPHSILTPGQPVSALTLHGQASGRVASGGRHLYELTEKNPYGESGNRCPVYCSRDGRRNHRAKEAVVLGIIIIIIMIIIIIIIVVVVVVMLMILFL